MKKKAEIIGYCTGVFVVLLCIGAVVVDKGLQIRDYPNDSNPPDSAAYILDERPTSGTNKHVLHSQLRFRITNGMATVSYVNQNVNEITNRFGALTGTSNFLDLSVQSAKLPTTNFPAINASWQDWELVYDKTNVEGSVAVLNSNWQLILPFDYATNSLRVRIYSLLLSTNGPNASNTIFQASVLRAKPDATSNLAVDLHTNVFGASISGTNLWGAGYTGTNIVQSVVISMGTNSMLQAGDFFILKICRDAVNDTIGGATSIVGLQLEYVRR